MTSLAASPLVPLGTAALAGVLIAGTMFGGNSETATAESTAEAARVSATQGGADTAVAEVADPTGTTDAAAIEGATPTQPAPAAAAAVLGASCATGPACTAKFPIAGGTATIFGGPVSVAQVTPKSATVTAGGATATVTKKPTKVGTQTWKIKAAGTENVVFTITKG